MENVPILGGETTHCQPKESYRAPVRMLVIHNVSGCLVGCVGTLLTIR